MLHRLHRVNDVIIARARAMRRESAPAEQILWFCLRDRRLNGYKFRRQLAVGPFIADFYCASCRLIVELDGDSHANRAAYDEDRTKWLNEHGHAVVRFPNADVFDHLDAVLELLLSECERRSSSTTVA